MTSTTDPLGHTTTYHYDGLNRQVETIDALGGTSITAYDAAGNVTSTTDPLGHTTTNGYDADNRQTSTTDPLGNVTTTAYDADGNVISTTDPLGRTTTYHYDALDRQTQTIDALGGTTTTAYDADGNVVSTTDPLGHTTTYGYDALNRQTSTTDPLGHTTTTAYDADGNVTSTTDPTGAVTTYGYDALNRQVSVTDPLGHATTTAYDADGNVTSTTDPLGHSTTYGYDALNRQTSVIDALGGTTTTAYDADGNVTSVTDPVGNVTTYQYDALNRKTSTIDPLGHTSTYQYDAAGRMTSTTDRDGRTRTFSYDADDRLTTETWYDAGNTIVNTESYTYDAVGNRLTASDNNSSYSSTYDALNRVITVFEPFGLSLSYTYDAAGNRTGMTDSAGGTTAYVYDAANRLTSLQFGGAGQTPLRLDMTYTARNELATESRYSDLAGTLLVGTSAYTYDAAGRLTQLQQNDGSSNPLASYVYTYDAAGNLTSETLNGGTPTNYTYDATNQLTNDTTTSYSYDANGNRTMAGYSTGANNQITSDGTWTYTYDNEGNIVKKSKGASAETWTYAYDNLNRLVHVEDRATDGGTLIEQVNYIYDVLGNRIEEDVTAMSTAVTRFAYDGPNAWADLDLSNTLTTRRLYLDAIDAIIARTTVATGAAAWYLTDRLGSVRGLTDATGALQDQITYDGYGNVTAETNPSFGDRYKFTAREFDSATGLQYNRARYYDPAIGRWTSQDPLGFDGGDANLYRYVFNTPTRAVDPTGLGETEDEVFKLYKDIFDKDADKSYAASDKLEKLLASKDATTRKDAQYYTWQWLKTQDPAKAPSEQELAKIPCYITQLDSDKFTERQDAAKKLETIGPRALKPLQDKLKMKLPSLEYRRRIERSIEQINRNQGELKESLGNLRQVLYVNHISDEKLKRLIYGEVERLSRGDPESLETKSWKTIAKGYDNDFKRKLGERKPGN